jgi:hypothetical protein
MPRKRTDKTHGMGLQGDREEASVKNIIIYTLGI